MSAELDRLIAFSNSETECLDIALGNAIAHIEKLEAALAECAEKLWNSEYAAMVRYSPPSQAARQFADESVAKYMEMLR